MKLGLRLLPLLLILAVAPAFAATSYQVNHGASLAITEHTVCRLVTNNHAAGLAIFVPTATSGEWASFYNGPPAGVTAVTCDSTPDAFNFTDLSNQARSTLIVSNILQISGITGNVMTSITGGGGAQYRICTNGSSSAACDGSLVQNWTTGPATIQNNQYLQLRLTSGSSFGAMVSATMTVGAGSNQWDVAAFDGVLNNPSPAADDHFGTTTALSGNLAIVGALLDDPGGVTDAGSAYVFNVTTGALVATLNNPAPATGDWFGIQVDIDAAIAVVGATRDDPGGVTDAGTAYTFNATTGALVATLNNPNPTANDRFGSEVAISGNTVIVGAGNEDPGGVQDAGIAYVFNATTGALITTINNPAPSMYDYFGQGIGLEGNTAVISAWADRPGGVLYAGTAYTFNATTGALIATLNNPTPVTYDYFGDFAVDLSGTVAVIGADGDDPGGVIDAGTAYVFNAGTGALINTLNNPSPTAGDIFSYAALAVAGNTAVVGSLADDPGGVSDAGSAYVFNTTTGALTATLSNPDPTAGDMFGESIAIDGGIIIVGSSENDPGGIGNAGTAYLFNAP